MNEVEILEIGEKCCAQMARLLNKKVESIVSLTKEEKGWKALIEVLERKAVPDTHDLLGRYEVTMDPNGRVLKYSQTLIRYRSDRLGIEFREAKE
ncbi:MAG: gas vesicle protein [Thaumarchaeota archaeon]|nr:gas vesicle protein [Nitrososphaerota archaeon]